ncbi:MAG: M48 family metallopeptidase [Thermoguttaceae bacterium]|nr:M48 family metallopeptidase [Thermoguttaceae bacterium]
MSTMNFFEHQDRARKATRRLYFYYFLAVLFVIVALNVGLLGLLIIIPQIYCSDSHIDYSYLNAENLFGIVSTITGVSSLIIFSGAGVRSVQLRSLNGGQVAESLGGRLVAANTRDQQERQLLNIVEEMSIASGVPVPKVYILDNEKSINAFASGWSTDEAAIAVTRGSLDYFTRDELQGVIGHEFSHILNGDMTVDMRMVGLLFGLELIFLFGYLLLRIVTELSDSRSSSKDGNSGGGGGVFMLVGLIIMIIGYIGKVSANLIRMAVSRQKEYLADASSVQFTRNPEGIGYALIKIGQINSRNPITNPNAAACGHFFFASIDSSLWDSHPPLKKRIARILPLYDGKVPQSVLRDLQDPPGKRYSEDDDSKKNRNPLDEIRQRMPEQLRHVHIPILGGGVLGGAAVDSAVQSSDELESLNDLIHDQYSVHGVIYALLMDSNPDIQNMQWDVLRRSQNEYMLKLVERLSPRVNSLTCADKIRIAELSVTALRQMSHEQYRTFRDNIVALTEADQRIDLFEFALRMILTGRLDASFGMKKNFVYYDKAEQLTREFCLALGYLAWQGANDEQDANNAFQTAVKLTNLNIATPSRSSCNMKAFANSLIKIQNASAAIRETFFNAFVACINYDGKITPKEEDLVNVIGACLNQVCDIHSTENP